MATMTGRLFYFTLFRDYHNHLEQNFSGIDGLLFRPEPYIHSLQSQETCHKKWISYLINWKGRLHLEINQKPLNDPPCRRLFHGWLLGAHSMALGLKNRSQNIPWRVSLTSWLKLLLLPKPNSWPLSTATAYRVSTFINHTFCGWHGWWF